VELALLAIWFIQGLVFAFFCGYIAEEKGRSSGTWFLLGFFFSIVAVLALVAVPRIDSPAHAPSTGGEGGFSPPDMQVQPSDLPQEFLGRREISLPAYQLFLTKRFEIERNKTLEVFTIGDQVFETIEGALLQADSMYSDELFAREKEQKEQLAKQKLRDEELENARLEWEAQEKIRVEEELRLAPIREAKGKKIELTLVACALIFLGALALYEIKKHREIEANELAGRIEKARIDAEMQAAAAAKLEEDEKIKDELKMFFFNRSFFWIQDGKQS
jgi:hypothetical protein